MFDRLAIDSGEPPETVVEVKQQPNDETYGAWHKESARLGEIGTVWIAARLTWGEAPETVFCTSFSCEGDEVTLLGSDGGTFTYALEGVRQESNLRSCSRRSSG